MLIVLRENIKQIDFLTQNSCISDLNHTCRSQDGPGGCWKDPPKDICSFDLQCNGIDDYKYCSGESYKLEDMDELNCKSRCHQLF